MKPEGRAGIYLVSIQEAQDLIRSIPEERIHNFLSEANNPMLIGADWDKSNAVKWIPTAERLAIIFPPNDTLKHQLVAIKDGKRYAFDIGEIPEPKEDK